MTGLALSSFSRKFIGGILALGIILSPVYVFDSGLPQPADFVLLLFSIIVFGSVVTSRSPVHVSGPLLLFGLLVLWVLLISLVWSFWEGQVAFLAYPPFYIFNFIFSSALFWYLREFPECRDLVSKSYGAALLVAAAAVFVFSSEYGRATGSFNNPNQLAFFSLCALLIILVRNDFRLSVHFFPLIPAIAAIFCILVASSLAAIAALLLILLTLLLVNGLSLRKIFTVILWIIALGVILFAADFLLGGLLYDNLMARYDRLGYKVENVYEERKYERMVDYFWYNFIGAGEGSFYRFWPHIYTEIHSSFGTLIFSYGVVGIGLFLAFLFVALRQVPLIMLPACMAPLVYSLTHNGLRTTIFWASFIFIYVHFSEIRRSERYNQST